LEHISDGIFQEETYEYSSRPNGASFLPPLLSERKGSKSRRRRRGSRIPGITKVRSVEGMTKQFLAKLYGNVDPKRVQIEGCSRTDKGVHAKCLIALFYCLSEDSAASVDITEMGPRSLTDNKSSKASIPGKRMPHPTCQTDTSSFVPLPCGGDMDKITFCLNRMLPPDIRINSISPTPVKNKKLRPFHPTLDASAKTYQYSFSIGHVHDPVRWRNVWHLDSVDDFDTIVANAAAQMFVGKHDFAAFRGAFRGSDRGRVQDTVCTLNAVTIEEECDGTLDCMNPLPIDGFKVGGKVDMALGQGLQPLKTFTVTITGDRFLYKMVRFVVGAIVSAGFGQIDSDEIRRALEVGVWDDSSGKRQRMCAPSHGLVLQTVHYPDELIFEWVETTNPTD